MIDNELVKKIVDYWMKSGTLNENIEKYMTMFGKGEEEDS
jgi:hypothetical protein